MELVSKKQLEERIQSLIKNGQVKDGETPTFTCPSILRTPYIKYSKTKDKPERIFKSANPTDFSLTTNGFFRIVDLKIFPIVFQDKITNGEHPSINALITLNKIFNSPYLLQSNCLFQFDACITAEKTFFGGFNNLIEYYNRS